MTSPRNSDRLRFGHFEADLASGELFRNGRRIVLQELPFQLLLALLSKPGRLLKREELIARFWPGGLCSDDDSLNTAIRKIRLALGDDARNPKYIETIGRRGYCFLMPVHQVERKSMPSQVWIGVVEGLAQDRECSFTRGVVEEVITHLSRTHPQLRIFALGARESVEAAAEERRRTQRKLDYFLACSARKRESQIRITGKLIRATDRSLGWAQSFDYTGADLLTTPEDAAIQITDAVISRVFHNFPSNPQA
jgi:DNA-binding winged helix-turn-helix (wHTH) protein